MPSIAAPPHVSSNLTPGSLISGNEFTERRCLKRALPHTTDAGWRIVWNGYGFEQATLVIARVAAQFFGAAYKRITLTNNGRNNGAVYINGAVGYAIAPRETLAAITRYDFGWQLPDVVQCDNCGRWFPDDEMYTDKHGQDLCYDCYYYG